MTALKGNPKTYSLMDLNSNGLTGTCLCGSITITITSKDLFTKPNGHICHCLNCRKSTGSSAWNVILVPTENVHIQDPRGYIKNYMDGDTSTGRPIPRSFCSTCGSTLGNVPPEAERKEISHVPIALGIFPRMPEPEFELFCAHRQAWLPPAVPEEKQFASRAEMEGKY